MYIRCTSCNASTRSRLGNLPAELACRSCGRTYDLSHIGELGATPRARFHRALKFTETERVDLASAYAVLLGHMSLEQARRIMRDASPARRLASRKRREREQPERPAIQETGYDPGFKRAVAEGHLSARQAIQRGDRVLFASTLTRKHKMDLSLAFMVADNRISVGRALAESQRIARGKGALQMLLAAPAPGRQRPRPAVALAAALVLACAGIWSLQRLSESGSAGPRGSSGRRHTAPAWVASPVETPDTQVRVDPYGDVTLVAGPDPLAVLVAFCKSKSGEPRRQVVRVTPGEEQWTGTYTEGDETRSIVIRWLEDEERWVADGKSRPVTVGA